MIAIRQREQFLAQMAAIGEMEAAHAADGVARQAVLDLAVADEGVPAGHSVEVADHAPDFLDRRVDDVADIDADHACFPIIL